MHLLNFLAELHCRLLTALTKLVSIPDTMPAFLHVALAGAAL